MAAAKMAAGENISEKQQHQHVGAARSNDIKSLAASHRRVMTRYQHGNARH